MLETMPLNPCLSDPFEEKTLPMQEELRLPPAAVLQRSAAEVLMEQRCQAITAPPAPAFLP